MIEQTSGNVSGPLELKFAGIDYGFNDDKTILGISSAFTNIFSVSLIERSDPNDSDLNDIPIRNISGLEIPNLSISLERALLTRKYHVKMNETLTYYGKIKIDWLEDLQFNVLAFHDKWKSYYYNTDTNTWVSGRNNKFISLKISVGSEVNENIFNDPLDASGNVLEIILENISIPSVLPSLDLDYNKTDQIKYSLEYPVEIVRGRLL